MRLSERSMLRIAADVRAGDLADATPPDEPGTVESSEEQVTHRHWLKERMAASTAPVERVRFRVKWTGRIWRLRSSGSQG